MNTGTGVPVRLAVSPANARALVRCAQNRRLFGHYFTRVQHVRARLRGRRSRNRWTSKRGRTERSAAAPPGEPARQSVAGRLHETDPTNARAFVRCAQNCRLFGHYFARVQQVRARLRKPEGEPNRPKVGGQGRTGGRSEQAEGAEPSRTATTAEVCGTCCRGRRLGSLHSALRGNGCVATLLRDRPLGFVARRWCRARRWHRR